MKRYIPHFALIFIACVALVSGCITEDFPTPADRTNNNGGGNNGGGNDVGANADADAEVVQCVDNDDCAPYAGPNQTGICQPSTNTCRFRCSGSYEDCDQDSTNGCEVDTSSQPDNCGSCGTVCTHKGTHRVPVCISGVCELDSSQCLDGWADRDDSLDCECELAGEAGSPDEERNLECKN